MNLYRTESSDPKYDAQRNLSGRTHYADESTLRSFNARIQSTYVEANGLLFCLIETIPSGTNGKRLYHPVIFDVFGTVIERPKREDSFGSHHAAYEAMKRALTEIDAKEITRKAIESAIKYHAMEMAALLAKVNAN